MHTRVEEGPAFGRVAHPGGFRFGRGGRIAGFQPAQLEHPNLADTALGDQSVRGAGGRGVAGGLHDTQRDARVPARGDHGVALRGTDRHRLFDQNVLARGGSPDHVLLVATVRRRDEDDIDVGTLQEVV